jgi:hypothetical protein
MNKYTAYIFLTFSRYNHAGLLHLGMNMISLHRLGGDLEVCLGFSASLPSVLNCMPVLDNLMVSFILAPHQIDRENSAGNVYASFTI